MGNDTKTPAEREGEIQEWRETVLAEAEAAAGGRVIPRHWHCLKRLLDEVPLRPAPCEESPTEDVTADVWPDPTREMLSDPQFNAVWNAIKTWDINVPGVYGGYMGATGNHVRAIVDALKSPLVPDAVDAEEPEPEYFCTTEQFKEIFGDLDDQPDAVDAEPVGYGCDRLRTLLDQLERLAYDQGFYNNSDGNQRELQHVIDATKKAILDHPAPASGKLAEYEQIGYIQKFLPPYGDDPNVRYFGYDAQYDRITKYTAQSNATDNPAKTEVVPVFSLRATATPRKEEE